MESQGLPATCVHRVPMSYIKVEWILGIASIHLTYEGDQWIHAELIVRGDSVVTHIINGENVLEYTNPQMGGGVANRFNPALKIDGQRLKSGFIALQSEGQEIDFKNIELLDMSKQK